MRLKGFLFIFFNALWFNNSNAQIFLVNLNDTDFIFNENTLRSKDKVCYVLNCLGRDYIDHGAFPIKPLIVIKVFDHMGKKINVSKPVNAIDLKDYLKKTVLSKLSSDMWLKMDNLETANTEPNLLLFDSLIVNDGKSYLLVRGGVSISEFFNIYPYQQLNLLQTNQSVFNTKSLIAPIHSWTPDSLPIPNVEEILGGKIFLLKKVKEEYTFFRHPFDCSDCPFSFYNEYVYKSGYGIVAFRSKYLQNYSNERSQDLSGKINESNKYYNFR